MDAAIVVDEGPARAQFLGVELFRPPGEVLLVEKARDEAEASGWIPEREGPAGPGRDRLETVREHRDALWRAQKMR